MISKKAKILVVEDEEVILRGLLDVLVFNGYEVDSAQEGPEGLQKAQSQNYDLILLDVMLPGLDGFSICEQVRKNDKHVPIIMLTAKSGDDDIINGLKLGADDYVAKPFSVRVLLGRIESVLRRTGKLDHSMQYLHLGETVKLDTENLTASFHDESREKVDFTGLEMNLLLYLHAQKDRPVSREEMLVQVWGYSKNSSVETRTVDIHIAKIRKKIERDPKDPDFLVTVRGKGYRLDKAHVGS